MVMMINQEYTVRYDMDMMLTRKQTVEEDKKKETNKQNPKITVEKQVDFCAYKV